MGGTISTGANNDQMIDNLINSGYIRTPVVEKVFQSVDRAFYFLPEFKHAAYRDLAWKQGNLHLSAPCIYSEVLEHLKLEPGLHFLNIGSGTGYLSTLAGLILGPYGINHGIEVHSDVVEYAYEKLEQFKRTCNSVDVFEFCEPTFVVGNVFNLNHDRRYDRIYCGAACPEVHQEHIKKLMKVGGILVLPCEDDLLKIVRISEDTWVVDSVLPVSFSTLQFPDKKTSTMMSMPDPEPLRLQDICRSTIRSLIRSIAEKEEPELTQRRKFNPKFYDWEAFRRVMRSFTQNHQNFNDPARENEQNDIRHDSENDDSDVSLNFDPNENESDANSRARDEEKNYIDVAEKVGNSNEEIPTCSKLLQNADDCIPCSSRDAFDHEKSKNAKDATQSSGSSITEIDHTVTSKVTSKDISAKKSSSRSLKFAIKIKKQRLATKIKPTNKHASPVKNDVNHNSLKQTFDEAEESANDSKPRKVMKREKLDSGISEESDDGKISLSNESSMSESTCNEPMEIESDDSDFTEGSTSEASNSEAETNDTQHSTSDYISLKYRQSMEKKIKLLPLPNAVKLYLNYNREFCISC